MSRFDFTRKDYAIPARPRVRNPERMVKWIEDILDSYYEDRLTLEHDPSYSRAREEAYNQMLGELKTNYARILLGEPIGRRR